MSTYTTGCVRSSDPMGVVCSASAANADHTCRKEPYTGILMYSLLKRKSASSTPSLVCSLLLWASSRRPNVVECFHSITATVTGIWPVSVEFVKLGWLSSASVFGLGTSTLASGRTWMKAAVAKNSAICDSLCPVWFSSLVPCKFWHDLRNAASPIRDTREH